MHRQSKQFDCMFVYGGCIQELAGRAIHDAVVDFKSGWLVGMAI